jgi:predicted transcriptional regulator
MKSFSFNTSRVIKRKIEIFAALLGCSQEAVISKAVEMYIDVVCVGNSRSIASSVKLDDELADKLLVKHQETKMPRSKIIDLCLRKYVENNQAELTSSVVSIDRLVA